MQVQPQRKRPATAGGPASSRMAIDRPPPPPPTRVLTRSTARRTSPLAIALSDADALALLKRAHGETELPPALHAALPTGVGARVTLHPPSPATIDDVASVTLELNGLICGSQERMLTIRRAYVRRTDPEAVRAWAVVVAFAAEVAAGAVGQTPRLLEALVLLVAGREAYAAFLEDPDTLALLRPQARAQAQARAAQQQQQQQQGRKRARPLDRHGDGNDRCTRLARPPTESGLRLFFDSLQRFASRHLTQGFQHGAPVAMLQEIAWMQAVIRDMTTPVAQNAPPQQPYARPSNSLPGADVREPPPPPQPPTSAAAPNVRPDDARKLKALADKLEAFRQPATLRAFEDAAALADHFAALRRAFVAAVRAAERLPHGTRLKYGQVLRLMDRLSLQPQGQAQGQLQGQQSRPPQWPAVKPQPQPQQSVGPTGPTGPSPPLPHPFAPFSHDDLLLIDLQLDRFASWLRPAFLRLLSIPPPGSPGAPPLPDTYAADAALLGHQDIQDYFREVTRPRSRKQARPLLQAAPRPPAASLPAGLRLQHDASANANANAAAGPSGSTSRNNAHPSIQSLLDQFNRQFHPTDQAALKASLDTLTLQSQQPPQPQPQSNAQKARRIEKGKMPAYPRPS
jgi:hypothetical protein